MNSTKPVSLSNESNQIKSNQISMAILVEYIKQKTINQSIKPTFPMVPEPFAICGHGKDAKVDENAEFRLVVPGR